MLNKVSIRIDVYIKSFFLCCAVRAYYFPLIITIRLSLCYELCWLYFVSLSLSFMVLHHSKKKTLESIHDPHRDL